MSIRAIQIGELVGAISQLARGRTGMASDQEVGGVISAEHILTVVSEAMRQLPDDELGNLLSGLDRLIKDGPDPSGVPELDNPAPSEPFARDRGGISARWQHACGNLR
jgi:hypothetical protein